MRKSVLTVLSLLMILSLVLGACVGAPVTPSTDTGEAASGETAAADTSGELPRNETLYLAGIQWNPPTTFNPTNNDPTWPASGQYQQIFESLFVYNQLTGEIDPKIGASYEFVDETTINVTLQDGAAWHDGEVLDADDVIFTFGLGKQFSNLSFSTFWDYVSELNAVDATHLELKLNPDRLNPGIVKGFLSSVRIMPEHIWAERAAGADPVNQYVDLDPVGSGPYKVHSATPERIALVAVDNYWGESIFGSVGPKYVVHPIFKSNDDGNLALSNGTVDLSQQFVPQIWQMWEDGGKVGTWLSEEPYYIAGSIPIMIINVHKAGLDNPAVRRALAYSINYPLIAETAMSRYSSPANSSLIIPGGGEDKYFDEAQVEELGWSYDPAETARILEEEVGATKGSDGIYVLPDGTRLGPYTLRTPYGWTDWMTAVDVVAQNATAAGIEVISEFPDAGVVTSAIQNGDFDLNLWYIAGVGPSSPWQRFRDVLDDRGVPDFGETAFWNYGRFDTPEEVYTLLDQAGSTTDDAELVDLYSQLDKVFIENVPAIPLMYRPFQFYEFNSTYWTNFPTADNPTAPPMHESAGIGVYFQVTPAEQ